ncbi:hypothetical protein GCM10022252_56520 [Streptosporangium oxazolinicum]|uniref:Uncharacterized protein n=1 Tax=Streptosporangium oxazolinicum TaxID=909287 RepID=A0ABP8BA74_9ACTN
MRVAVLGHLRGLPVEDHVPGRHPRRDVWLAGGGGRGRSRSRDKREDCRESYQKTRHGMNAYQIPVPASQPPRYNRLNM